MSVVHVVMRRKVFIPRRCMYCLFFSISLLPQLPTDVVQRFNECLISGAPTPEDDMKAPLAAVGSYPFKGLHRHSCEMLVKCEVQVPKICKV